ncbi:hypothetical protein MMC06_000900 [Schaereria dolodes]|nr:hypothetical protein [Schaereria dolodes]
MAQNGEGLLTARLAPLIRPAQAEPHSPAHAWSYRVPSPPRIVVPPPSLNGSGVPEIPFNNRSQLDFESNGFANSEFLQTVTYGDFMIANHMLDWRYEQRRMAQAILPFLYLGPLSAARDRKYLQQEGITMVLAVRNTMSAQARLLGSKATSDLGIHSVTIDVADNQELIAAFPRTVEAINSHLSTIYQHQQSRKTDISNPTHDDGRGVGGKVLVFCESGNERSAGVVAAYIMAMYSFDLIETIQLVQAQRFCVAFDDSLKTLLQSYSTILQAKRDVVQYQALQAANLKTQNGNKKDAACRPRYVFEAKEKLCKRNLDDCYDDDMDMADASEPRDGARFEKREGYAPFEDKAMS